MFYNRNKRRNLPIVICAISAFLSTDTLALDSSDDESVYCGCFGGRNTSERKRLISDHDRPVSQPSLQVVVQEDNHGSSTLPSTTVPYQAAQGHLNTDTHPQGTPPRKESEGDPALPTSPSVKLNDIHVEAIFSELQRQILTAAQAEKISQRIWDLLSSGDNKFQAICDEINKPEYAEATFFDYSFRNANMCKLVITIHGNTTERRVAYYNH